MRQNRNKILATIFLALLILVLYPWAREKLPKGGGISPELKLSAFTAEQTKSITISKDNLTLKLDREGSEWKIATKTASASRMDLFFTALKNLTVKAAVSRNPENFAQYEVGSGSATLLSLRTSQASQDYLIGKYGPETDSFYLRLPDSNTVYLVGGSDLKRYLTEDPSEWRDKTIVKLDVAEINEIKVSGKINLVYRKNDKGKWMKNPDTASVNIEEEDMNKILSSFSYLSASGFATDAEEKNILPLEPDYQISLINKDKKILAELKLYISGDNYLVKSKDREDMFKIHKTEFDSLLEADKVK